MKILIIEDDLVLSANLQEKLEDKGYTVTGCAVNDVDAMWLFHKSPPDLVIADIHLEQSSKNGIEIVSAMKETRDLPIIYLTGFSDSEYVARAKNTTPSAYLLKPVMDNQIEIAIDFALNNFYKNQVEEKFTMPNTQCPLSKSPDAYFVKHGEKYVKISVKDMCILENDQSYTIIHTPYKKYTTSGYLAKTLAQISSEDIVRCHRKYAVNVQDIHAFNDRELTIAVGNNLYEIPLGDSFKQDILGKLNKIKSE